MQDFPKEDYEIIIISHGVTNAFDGPIFSQINKKNLKRIFVERLHDMPYQPCFVRNQGIFNAEGKLIFLMHDNVDLSGNDFLSNIWRLSNEGNRAVCTRKTVYRYNKDGSIGRDDTILGFYAQQDAIPYKYIRFVGGFDTIYDGDNGCDDVDLMMRCNKIGCEFFLAKNLLSIKHNLRDMYPEQKTIANGQRNYKILCERGFQKGIPDAVIPSKTK